MTATFLSYLLLRRWVLLVGPASLIRDIGRRLSAVSEYPRKQIWLKLGQGQVGHVAAPSVFNQPVSISTKGVLDQIPLLGWRGYRSSGRGLGLAVGTVGCYKPLLNRAFAEPLEINGGDGSFGAFGLSPKKVIVTTQPLQPAWADPGWHHGCRGPRGRLLEQINFTKNSR